MESLIDYTDHWIGLVRERLEIGSKLLSGSPNMNTKYKYKQNAPSPPGSILPDSLSFQKGTKITSQNIIEKRI